MRVGGAPSRGRTLKEKKGIETLPRRHGNREKIAALPYCETPVIAAGAGPPGESRGIAKGGGNEFYVPLFPLLNKRRLTVHSVSPGPFGRAAGVMMPGRPYAAKKARMLSRKAPAIG